MKRRFFLYIALLLGLAGCRTDDTIIYMEDEDTGIVTEKTEVLGMYLLNEGNMGSNKCTLDYLDLSGETIHYLRTTISRYMVRSSGSSSIARTRWRCVAPQMR